MDGLQHPSAELHALKDEFDRHSQQIAELRSDFQTLQRERRRDVNALAAISPLSRRQILQVGSVAGALALLGSSPALAATDPTDGDGDLGNSANPWDTYLNGLALDAEDISSATTVTKPVVRYDCSVSGFTITLSSDLEGPSGYVQPVVLIDETGSSGANAVTVDTQSGNGIDGGASITINHDHAVTTLYWDGSEWRSTRFIDTVDVGTATADSLGYDISPNNPSSNGFPDFIIPGGDAEMLWPDSDPSFNNTSYTTEFELTGGVEAREIPSDMSIYGNFHMFMQIDDASETVFARPALYTDPNGTTAISELEISHTGDTNFTIVCSGWQEITSINTDNFIGFVRVESKVSAGTATGQFSNTVAALHLVGSRGNT